MKMLDAPVQRERGRWILFLEGRADDRTDSTSSVPIANAFNVRAESDPRESSGKSILS